MIYFNGIELDYNSNTLNKIVIKKALSDIESLADRKGTTSTTFDVPRTAHNEKAFVNMTVEGSEFTSVGTGSIFLEGNEYARGKIYVRGYNDTVFQLLFLGDDVNFIKNIKDLKMSRLVNENASDVFMGAYLFYTDSDFTFSTENIRVKQLDYILSQPNILTPFGGVDLKAELLAPFFFVKTIIRNIVQAQGYSLSSSFFDSDYGGNLLFSNYEGTHKPVNYFNNGNTVAVSSLGYTLVAGGNALGGMTGGTYNYILDRDVAALNFRFHLNLSNDPKVERTTLTLITFDITATLIHASSEIELKEGENILNLEIDKAQALGTYYQLRISNTLKTGMSLPISQTVNLTEVAIRYDELQSGDILYLGDYLGSGTQLDFLKGIMKQYNLNMLIEDDNVVIELAENGETPNDLVALNGITNATKDITDKIESNIDVSISVKPNRNVYMDQKYIKSDSILEAGDDIAGFGSYDYDLETFGTYTDKIESDFNTTYDTFGDFVFYDILVWFKNIGEHLDGWDNLIGCWWSTDVIPTVPIGYQKIFQAAQDYTLIDGTIGTVNMPVINHKITRFKETAEHLFLKTLEQKKNNKVREIELYDHSGTLITFRSDYIIDNQIYKLLSYEFEPISKLVKAKIILK